MSGGGYSPGIKRVDDAPIAWADFLASRNYTVKRSGITIASALVVADGNGDKILKGGTALVPLTGGPHIGKYAPYLAAAANGQGAVPDDDSGLLFPGTLNLKDGDIVTGLLIHGTVYEARVFGVDAAVRAAFKGRIILL